MRRRDLLRWLHAQLAAGLTISHSDHVTMVGRGKMFISRSDNRGLRLLSEHGVTQPYVTWLWRSLSDALRPPILFDVGANYGEVSLSHSYPHGSRLFLFEPNPDVGRQLRRSIATRTDAGAFMVRADFLGLDRQRVDFWIDKKWSGTSSAYSPVQDASFKGPGEQRAERLEMVSRSLDSVMDELNIDLSSRTALMKIDVEGGESLVLQGAARSLEKLAGYAIIAEVSADLGRASRLGRLTEEFERAGEVLMFARGRPATLARAHLPELAKCDVLIARGEGVLRAIRRMRRPVWI